MSIFTVILPHKRNTGNDAALRHCLDCLFTNTVNDFTLIIDAAVDAPLYERVNNMVRQATTVLCVYLASDTFLAKDWDVPMLEAYTPETFVTGVLVEPGVIGLHPNNTLMDFGRTPDTFRRAEFEAWAQSKDATMSDNEGWFCPYLFNRERWLAFGGYSDGIAGHPSDFSGADALLWDRWKAAGNRIQRVRSFAYHLQRWSDVGEQTAEKRAL